jgi:hypothetical protein
MMIKDKSHGERNGKRKGSLAPDPFQLFHFSSFVKLVKCNQRNIMKRLSLILLIIMLTLTSCKQKLPEAEIIPEATETALPTASPEPSLTPEPSPEPEQFSTYAFDMTLDYARNTAQLIQTIDYLNKSNLSLPSLQLLIPPRTFANAYAQTELSGELVTGFTEDGVRTNIQLNQKLEPGERTTIRLVYSLTIPNRDGSFGYSQRQLNLNNWYPFIPPLASDGSWLSYEPLVDLAANSMVGEYLVNEIANFELDLRMTENLNVIVATGANASPVPGGMHYSLEKARGLAFSFSNQFHLEQSQLNGITINAYAFQYQKEKAKALLDIAANAIQLFSEIYGPYERNHISLASWDFSHSMEMDGFVLMSAGVINFYDNTAENNLTILLPHELAHQWFYSQVGNNQALEPWLDEALATYSEELYYERYHPELKQWWWDNRVYAHPYGGYVNNSIYDAKTYDIYRGSVYLRGSIFLHDLRINMGDAAFFSALKEYYNQNKLKIATKEDFIRVFQEASPQTDLTSVIARYFKD